MGKHKERYSNAFTATLSGIVDLFRKQKNTVTINEADQLSGKNVMITGASSGLGFEAAVQLARRGANTWMACRSGIPEKGKEVKHLSGNNQIEMLPVDLSDMESIGRLVLVLKQQDIKLDVVVCNAAVVPLQSRRTRQGLEEMFMVNYLSTYLLVRLLLEYNLLNTGGTEAPRIIIVDSESHRNPKEYDWENFGKYKEYTAGKTVELYGYYKLLLATLTCELSRRLNTGKKTTYSVFALCPGPVNSNIAREAPAIFKPLLKMVFALFFRSPAVAVQPLVYFATSKEVSNKPLDYLFLMSRKEIDEKAQDKANGTKLWQLSEDLLAKHGIIFRRPLADERITPAN